MVEVLNIAAQWLFLLLALMAPLALHLDVWRRLRRTSATDISIRWGMRVGYLGIATSFAAYTIPLATFVYMYILLNRGRPIEDGEMINCI